MGMFDDLIPSGTQSSGGTTVAEPPPPVSGKDQSRIGMFDDLIPSSAAPAATPQTTAAATDNAPGIMDYGKEFGSATVRGAAGTVASMGRGLGVLTTDDQKEIASVEQGIAGLTKMSPEQATTFMQSLPSRLSPAVAFNYQVAIRHLWRGDAEGAKPYLDAARKYTDTTPVEDQALTKGAQQLEQAASSAFPQDPRFKGSITSDLGQGLGSTIAFLPIGILSGGTGVAISGGLAGADQSYQQAKQDIQDGKYKGSNANSDALAAGRLGALPGGSEAVPIDMFLEQMPKYIPGLRTIANTPVWGKFAQAFGRMGMQALSEGGQEAFQQWAANVINKLKINPDQDVTEGVLYNALIGGAIGAGMQAPVEVYDAVRGHKEGAPAPSPTPAAPSPAAPPPRIDPTLFPAGPAPSGPAPGGPGPTSAGPGALGAPPPGPAPTPTNPVVTGQPTDAYLVGAGYTPEQISDMNPQEREAAIREAIAQGVEPVELSAGAPAPGTAPMAPRAPAGPAPAPAEPPRHQPGPGVWANQDQDLPVTILDEPPLQDPQSGEWYQRVKAGEGEGYVPFSQLQPQAPGTAPMAPRGTRTSKVNVQSEQDLEAVRPVVNVEPSEAQKAAGNYQLAHVKLHGLDISIENPKGSVRRGTDPDGETWESPPMPADYGYAKGSKARDGDHVDIFIGGNPASQKVFVIDQRDLRTGRFDEPKVILGADSISSALALYEGSFSDGRAAERIGAINETKPDELRQWLDSGPIKKPFAKTSRSATERWTGEARPQPPSGVSNLEGNADALSQSEHRAAQGLRGPGNNNLPGMDGGFRDVPAGYGAEANPEALTGQAEQQRPLQSAELPLGNANGAEPQQAPSSPDRVSRAGTDGLPVGGRAANAYQQDTGSPEARLDGGSRSNNARVDAAFTKYLEGKGPLTAPAIAKATGLTEQEAGAALQRAHAAGRIIPSRNGGFRRPPTRVAPLDVLSYIASKGGVSDPTGELRGMDLHRTMTPYGPVVRPSGMHPDKARELLVEAGYMRDAGRDSGGQAQSTVADFYDVMARAAGGEKIYVQEDQPRAAGIEAERKNRDQMPEDWADMHPIERAWGPEVWNKLQQALADADLVEENWSQAEIADAARMIAGGMEADDALEKAADIHVDDILNDEDFAPEITAAFKNNRRNAMEAFRASPPAWDLEEGNAAQQQGSPAPGQGVGPDGERRQEPDRQAEVSGRAAEVRGAGEAGPEAGSAGDSAGQNQAGRNKVGNADLLARLTTYLDNPDTSSNPTDGAGISAAPVFRKLISQESAYERLGMLRDLIRSWQEGAQKRPVKGKSKKAQAINAEVEKFNTRLSDVADKLFDSIAKKRDPLLIAAMQDAGIKFGDHVRYTDDVIDSRSGEAFGEPVEGEISLRNGLVSISSGGGIMFLSPDDIRTRIEKTGVPRSSERSTGSSGGERGDLTPSPQRGTQSLGQTSEHGNGAPTTETGADNKPQTVLPGAEAKTPEQAKAAAATTAAAKELELRQKQSKLRKGGQQSVEDQVGGMFAAPPPPDLFVDAPQRPAAATPEEPVEINRRWDWPVSKIEEMSGPDFHEGARWKAILRAWTGSLTDDQYRVLTKHAAYDFPKIMAGTAEPARLLAAWKETLRTGKTVTLAPGDYQHVLEETAAELLNKKPTAKGTKAISLQGNWWEPLIGGGDTGERTPRKSKSAAPDAKIEDFGEKILGARKDAVRDIVKSLEEDLDVAAEPLSKTFPLPDYEKLAAAGVDRKALALIAVMRDTIPTKPKKGWKLKDWAAKASMLRTFAQKLLNGTVTADEILEKMRSAEFRSLIHIANTADVIASVDPKILPYAAQFKIRSGAVSMLRGERFSPAKVIYYLEDDKGRWLDIDSTTLDGVRERAVEYIKAKAEKELNASGKTERRTPIHVYSDRHTKELFVGFKGVRGVIRLKSGFAKTSEARVYIKEHADELQKQIDDMREGPDLRRAANMPRKGPFRREGDATPELFQEAFGFRGVQFGNYVEGDRRQSDLNEAFDALMDLSDVLGIPSKALSLNGKLGLAFGARGHGGKGAAAAHYEPTQIVINLTKHAGPGSLAHEWLHALDHYFNRQNGAGEGRGYISEAKQRGDVREAVWTAWKAVEKAISRGEFARRSDKLDEARSKPYFGTTIEKAARAFEKYVVDRLNEKQTNNDYLANIELSSGAYPLDEEMQKEGIRKAFDDLFSSLEVTWSPDRKQAMLSSAAKKPVFYSGLLRIVEGLKQDKAPKAQWMNTIRNAPGVKPEELAWVGLEGWLAEQSGQITKQQIADFIRANQVQVDEVVKERRQVGSYRSSKDYENRLLEMGDQELADEYVSELGIDPEDALRMAIYETSDVMEELIARYEGTLANRGANSEGAYIEDDRKYKGYQLPGGENYRELLLTLPAKLNDGQLRAQQLRDDIAKMSREMREKYGAAWRFEDLTDEEQRDWDDMHALADYAESDGEKLARRENYTSSHWDEKNILAHIRFNERIDADGKRVLFIEEVQSDWHQQGRKGGYKTADLEKAKAEYDAISAIPEGQRSQAQWDAFHRAKQVVFNTQALVPDAPFKTTWPELAMKRMIRWAAENGFDRIAWAPGDVQAERYDLSKQISKVEYEDNYSGGIARPQMDGPPRRGMLRAWDTEGRRVMQESIEDPAKIADYIGKEAAEKLLNQPGREASSAGIGTRLKTLSGLDLQVGGEGMKGFYDKILVDVANKLGKKFGTKVSRTSVASGRKHRVYEGPTRTVEEVSRMLSVADTYGDRRQLEYIRSDMLRGKTFAQALEESASFTMAQKMGGVLREVEDQQPVPALDITDAMKMAAMEGQPLFSKANAVATISGSEIMNFTGPQDMPALRKAAQAWYADNLIGRTVAMADGTLVQFNAIGLRESTWGRKGDNLLRAVPAIPAIIQKGRVVLREPGSKPHILERLVISAPVNFMGEIRHMAVSVHHMKDGSFQYSFNMDRDAGGPGVSVPGGLMSARDMEVGLEGAANGVNLFEVSPDFKAPATKQTFDRRNPYRFVISQKQATRMIADVQQIAERILGHRIARVSVVTDQGAWNEAFGEEEDAVFDPNTGVIYIALHGTQDPRIAIRHEAIHALRQAGVISATEWAVLSRMARTRWIEQYNIRQRYEQLYRERFDISPDEIEELLVEEAIADAMAEHWGMPPAEDVVSRIFARIKAFLEGVGNMLRGNGFNTASDILGGLEQGSASRRAPGSGQGRDFLLYGRDDGQADLSSRGRLRPPRNPTPGSFEVPHDERVMRALLDSTDTLLSRISRAGSAVKNRFVRGFQDREADLARTQKAITEASGPIAEPSDAYLAASLYPGRVAQRDHDLVEDFVKPLVKDIADRKLTLEEVNDFLMLRHATERNAETGAIAKPGTQFAIALTNPSVKGGSGFSENEITDGMNRFRAAGKLADLTAVGDKVLDLNARTRDLLLNDGLITQEQYDALQKYQYYVPLRGWDDVTDENHPDAPRSGRRYDIRGREIQQAFGRTTKADSPLAYSILQARQAIIRAEKNRVGKRFLRLAQANPNPALWEVNRVELKKAIDKNTGYVRNVFDPGANEAENVYSVKVGGKRYNITLHHDGLLRAMKGIGGENMGDIVAFFAKINRYFAAINTSYSPEFLFTNFLRDLQHAGIVLQEEQVRGLTTKVLGSIPQAFDGMRRMLLDDLSTPWARYAREFADAGGKIGFMNRSDIEAEKASLEKLMKEANAGMTGQLWLKTKEHSLERLGRWNDSLENTLRLATYVNLRRAGVTQDKAASVARELTVNFNRKGEYGPLINSFWLFFNAATQGTAQLMVRLARSKKIRIVAGAIILESFLAGLLNGMLAGDDDDKKNRYDKIPADIKARYHIFMLPKEMEDKYGVAYIRVPLPLGWNIFHVAGEQAASAFRGAVSPLEAALNVASSIGDAFNVLGNGGTFLNTLTPTLLDPLTNITANTDDFGEKMIPDTYDRTTPNAERSSPNVAPWAKAITDELSKLTGGSPERKGAIDISPEWVEYVAKWMGGGVSRFFGNAMTTAQDWGDPDQFDVGKIPFARVFAGRPSKYEDRDEYYRIRDDVHVTEKELKARLKEGNLEEAKQIRADHAKELKMLPLVTTAEKQLAKLRKEYKATKNNLKMGDELKKQRLTALGKQMDDIQLKVRTRWNLLDEQGVTAPSSGGN